MSRNAVAALFYLAITTVGHAQDPSNNDAAVRFMEETENVLSHLDVAATLAAWTASVDITNENDKRALDASNAYREELQRRVAMSSSYSASDAVVKRKLRLLALEAQGSNADPKQAARRAELRQQMDNHYEQACAVVDPGIPCMAHDAIEREIRTTRDPQRLRQLWTAWYDTAKPQAARYEEYTKLKNQGARDSGLKDAAEASLAAYEVDPSTFERELDALWDEVRPLYLLLHAYVRDRLAARYPGEVDPKGPIPIHLLGNLWGQEWEGITDVLAPSARNDDSSGAFERANVTPVGMVRTAERFFTSLGFPPLPPAFFERSYFERPLGADGKPRANFACHATAWFIAQGDWRLRTCFTPNWADFLIAHHEIGHIFYNQSFDQQSYLFRGAPNQGINEAVGDAIMLSVTPDYLRKIGLPDLAPSDDENTLLMRVALRKVARIPFGLMLQRWRWGVQSGRIPPEQYNEAWWKLVREYQGLVPPAPRAADAFDPAAKKHIAADIDYVRYFLADVLTFQIHDSLSRKAGCTEPLHRCSIYESQGAGAQLRGALSLGSSRHWREVLEALTGSASVRGEPLRHYLAPLEAWLANETRTSKIGWN